MIAIDLNQELIEASNAVAAAEASMVTQQRHLAIAERSPSSSQSNVVMLRRAVLSAASAVEAAKARLARLELASR